MADQLPCGKCGHYPVVCDDLIKHWQGRAEEAEALLARIAKANVIFPSMCANNIEAWNLSHEIQTYAASESAK